MLCVALAGGCRTAPIPAFSAIDVPSGLSSQQVDLAILSGILNKPPPADYDPHAPLSAEEFSKLVWANYLRDARSRSWFPESREPGVVIAAVSTRGLYLRVALRFDESAIHTEILESRNLDQTEGRIHRRALQWIERLRQHIRRELGRMSFTAASSSTRP